MGKPLDFALYNPDQLEDEVFLAGFIARQELADKILSRLGKIKRRDLAQHRLLVGQRGMGKTSLLRRIGLGVRDQPALSAVLLPLSFREEQYNVHNLHVFWCNCIDALGDWLEAAGREDEAGRLDREVAALNAQEDDEEGSQALALFREWMNKEQRRPLLLLDNLDIIFAGLKNKQWSLRRVLQEAGGVVVVGASAAALEAAADREGAFYDFFQVDVLSKLEHHEILLCLRHMARQREKAGGKVLQILDRDPARIHVLYDLTGGNPRTLAMLYLVLETGGDDDVMRDLERLLDQATPLYKARVEELAPQARVVFDALALAWDPATAADLAALTGLEVGMVSAQLDRLFKEGVVEKTSLSSTHRTAFQVAERFFNIWYLMRHSPRRQRQRLRWLTEMLRRIYSPRELRERAAGLLAGGEGSKLSSAAFCLALSEAVEDRELRAALRSSASQRLPPTAQADLRSENDFGGATVTSDPAGGDASVIPPGTTAATYRKAIEQSPGDPGLWDGLGKLLLRSPDSREEAEAAFRKSIELDPGRAQPWNNLGRILTEQPGRHSEAEAAFRRAIEIEPNNVGLWIHLGFLLEHSPERHSDAEAAYRQAIKIDSKNLPAWNNLGLVLAGPLERFSEAEAAYRKAIEIDPRDWQPWNNLGVLLAGSLQRFSEAEAAFRKAIEIDPRDWQPWNNLGILLAGPLQRFIEAEAAYRKAIEIDPTGLLPWNNLGSLLAGPLQRFSEAEAAFRKAIEIDPTGLLPWNNLGKLLGGPLERFSEAEAAFRKAIGIDPANPWPWNNLGKLLAEQLERFSEAEAAFRKAIEIDPTDWLPWNNLGILLTGPLQRFSEAAAAFRKAIEINPEAAGPWIGLGNLLADRLFRFDEAEKAYSTAIRIAPYTPYALGNLAYLLLRRDGNRADAETSYQAALAILPPHGAGLLRTFHALAVDNFGTATVELGRVLEEGHPQLFTDFRDDLLRILQLAADRGSGEKLLAWLKSSHFSDRYWPLHVAFDAYLHGEDRLMDVNPEVRNGARRLLSEMTRPPRELPQPEPRKKPRRKKQTP